MSNNNKINIDDKVNADTINSIAGCKAEDDNKTTANVSTAPTTVNEKAETKGATTNQKSFNDQRKVESLEIRNSNFQPEMTSATNSSRMTIPDSASDYNQWLHAMKMVAILPGGLPIEFRRKLWLALSERYLKFRKVDWNKEQIMWFSENCRADDEELNIQIVKDLHRTGSSWLSGPAGASNQVKLKRVLIGYSRFNPIVGYCQGFNMLGALILQVMGKNELDAIKVMIFLIEGILPPGYFCGSLSGLQADMAVFRDLLGTKLPKLARHLQKLQSSLGDSSFEPPITNVFTMTWFLTLYIQNLPMANVLRIWDLIMIEGSDVLLRTALIIWHLLESQILKIQTADDFYCKMESFTAKLLSGSLIDSNSLIQRISDLGKIPDLQKMRDKQLKIHLSIKEKKGAKLLYTDDDAENVEESRMTVSAAWGRRGSASARTDSHRQTDREKIALDINILKKQYDKLRERQKQAHIILTTACTRQPARQPQPTSSLPLQMNKLLIGKNAIISKGRRPPTKGAIPPVRVSNKQHTKPSKPVKHVKEESKTWKEKEETRRHSMKWHDIKADRASSSGDPFCSADAKIQKSSSASSLNSFKRRSDSSSYSEDSDNEDGGESSTSTSLCDDLGYSASSVEASPIKKKHSSELPIDKVHRMKLKKSIERSCAIVDFEEVEEPDITKSVSDTEDNKESEAYSRNIFLNLPNNEDELANTILSISQLSPMPDISKYFESSSSISPLKTPSNFFDFSDFATDYSNYDTELDEIRDLKFEVDDEGVTNELFERINLERSDTELNEYIFSKPGPSESEINATDIEKLSPLQKSGSSTSLNFENIGSQQIAPFTLEITNTSEMNIQACDENLSKNLNDDVVALNSFSPEDSISSDSSSKMTKLIEENSRMLNDMLRRSVSEDLNLTIDTIMEESEPTTPLQDIVMLTDHIIFSKTTKNDETFEMISRKTLNIICEETIPEEAEESEVTPTNKHFENVEEIVKKSDIIPEILISLHEDSETESSFEIIESTTDLWEPPEVAVEPLPILEKENIVATKSFQDKIVSSYDEAIELIEKVTQENASYEDENMMVCSKTITESSDATVQTPNTSYVNEQVIRCIKEPIQINAEIVPDNQLIDLPNKNILDSFKNIENNDNINPITLNEKCLEEETWNIACYQENNQTIYRNISPIDLLESSTKTKNIPFLEQRPEDIINELLASKDVKHVRAPNTETFNFYKHEDDDSNKFSRDQCSVQGMDKNADNIPSESQTINLLEADKNSALSNSEKILENLNIQLARYSQYVKIEKELKFPSDLIVCEKVEEKKSIKYHDEKLENVEEHSIKIQEYEENTTSIREKADIFENLQKPFIDDAHIELSQLNQEDVSSVSFKNEKTILKKHDLKHKDFYHKIELKGEFKSQDDLKPYPIEKSASDKVLEKLHLQLDKYDEIPIKSPQVDQSDRLPYNKSLANLEELLNKNDGISNASSLQASYSSEKTPVEDESTLQSFSESGYQPLSDAKREFYLNSVYDLLNQDYKKDGSDKELVIKKPQKTNSNDSICSSTSTISDTLSSIKNSIKSIDSLCQKKSEYSNAKRRNKTIEDIEKICENDKDWKIYKRTVSPITTINQDPYSEYAISRPKDLLNDSNSNSLKPTKMARDRSRSRDRTPRGKRNDSIDDYNLQNVRDPSPRIAIKVEDVEDSSRKYYGTYDNDNYKSPTSKSPTSYKSEKGMIRQASVTSTFYDRFQYYKKEQNYDNSPVSPPKNLSHSPRSPRSPAHTSTSSFHLKSPTSPTEIRASKSAENSPSRYLEESIKNYKSTLSPGRSSGSIYKSYDDISERVNAADKKFKDLTTRSNQYREFEPFDENIYFRKKTS